MTSLTVESDIIKLLDTLVSYNTVNDPNRGVKPTREIADFIFEWLSKHEIYSDIIESSGYYSVFGYLGQKPPCVGLLAHYDTVPVAPERWSYDPFKLTIAGGRAYGRGALDDKSNVASILVALEKLKAHQPDFGVVFALTGDEEIGGSNGALVVSQKLQAEGTLQKYLINGDGTGMVPIVRRRKSFSAEVRVKSRKTLIKGSLRTVKFTAYYPVSQHAHAAYFIGSVDSHPLVSASVFIRENNAFVRTIRGAFLKSNVIPPEAEVEYVIPDPRGEDVEIDEGLTELVRALLPIVRAPIRTRAYSEYGVSITPNVYSFSEGCHRVVFDVRAMSLKEDVEESLREVLSESLYDAVISVRTDVGGYLNTSPRSKVVESLVTSLEEVGVRPYLAEGAGASDSRYFTSLGVEAVDIGPRGGNMHGDNEYVEVESLKLMPAVYYRAVKMLSK